MRLSSSPRHPEATLHLAGFHLPAKVRGVVGTKRGVGGERNGGVEPGAAVFPQHKRPRKGRQQHGPDSSTELPDNAEFGSFLYWRPPLPSIEDELQEMLVSAHCPASRLPGVHSTNRPSPQKTHSISSSPAATDELQNSEDGDGAEEEEDDEEESDDDNEGWITPSNLKQVQQDTGHCDTVPANVQVGCVTTDFSMQVSAASHGAGSSPQLG